MPGRLLQRTLRFSLGYLTAAAVASAISAGASPASANAAAANASASAKSTRETALGRIQRTVAKIDAEATTPEGEAAVVKRLSGQLAVSEDSLKTQHDSWGLGYGEIAMAYGFARASRTGKTPGDVVAMRSAGSGWLDIAKELRVKVDTVARRMQRHTRPSPR
jgi:hypothetical protein